jgi:hypothetical protein
VEHRFEPERLPGDQRSLREECFAAVERRVGHQVAYLLEPKPQLLVDEHLLQPLEVLRRVEPVACLGAL